MIGNISTGMLARPIAQTMERGSGSPVAMPSVAAPPSVVVTLSGAGAPPVSPVYARPAMPVWQTSSDDAVTLRMARQYDASTDGARFAGLGAALVGQFAAEGVDFAQAVSTRGAQGSDGTAFSLSVTTASGKTVTFALTGSDGELQVRARGSATLDDAERAAVAKLADGFQAAIDGLAGSPPKLDLAALAAFGKHAFASVDVTASVASANRAPVTLAFHADTGGRTLKLTSAEGVVDIGVDASSGAILGTASQRDRAMANVLSEVDKATARGHGDRFLAAMFKDAFRQLHAADDVPSGTTRPMAASLSKAEHAMLSGLADYHASIVQTAVASNPYRADEKDAFSYDTSQATRIGEGGMRNRELSQRRDTHLLASFHSPLTVGGTLSLTDDPLSQNYLYTQIDDRASSLAEIGYRDGKLVKASLTLSASQSTHQMKYVFGRLVDETTTPASRTSTQDFLELLADADELSPSTTRRREAERERVYASVNQRIRLESDPSSV